MRHLVARMPFAVLYGFVCRIAGSFKNAHALNLMLIDFVMAATVVRYIAVCVHAEKGSGFWGTGHWTVDMALVVIASIHKT